MDGISKGTADLHVVEHHGGDPAVDLAVEGDLLEEAGRGRSSLFCYSWEGPVVILGYGQPETDADLEWCRARGIEVLRRLTGGTGVVHRRDLAVSLFFPVSDPLGRDVVGLYSTFLKVLAPSLNRVGGQVVFKHDAEPARRDRSPVCFEDQSADTLLAGERKVVGCAQARRSGGILVHAAVSLDLASDVYAGAFGVSDDRIRSGLGDAVPGGDPATVAAAVAHDFAAALGRRPVPTPVPEPSAARLAAYRTPRWRPSTGS